MREMTPEIREVFNDGWLPTLVEIERRKDDPIHGEYWRQFGWGEIQCPSDCPKVAARLDVLGRLFLDRYAFRMIGHETMEKWQIRLQSCFDRNVHVFERAYALYDRYKNQMDDVIEGETVERDMTDGLSGTDKRTVTGQSTAGGSDVVEHTGTQGLEAESLDKRAATPDTVINTADDWGSDVSKTTARNTRTDLLKDSMTHGKTLATEDTDSTVYGKQRKVMDSTVTTVDGHTLERVNAAVDAVRDLDIDFISRFENLFLNVLWM